ncbi:MAG: aminotransferase class IV [Chthoniobacteraceae bacterium]
MSAWQWTGGQFAPTISVPLTDRGFRYGMAFFESVAVRGGQAEFLLEHLARLEAACAKVGWPVDFHVLQQAGKQLEALAHASPTPLFGRIYVTAGDGGPAEPVTAPRVLVFAEPRANPVAHTVAVREHPEPFLPVLGGLKTANYWANAEALRQAHAAGAGEALLFNPHGELVSACMANVFVELDGVWMTPPSAQGARDGVTREWVRQRRAVAEGPIRREDLARATGAFLTSCWSGPVPVERLDGRALATGFAEALAAEFLERL